MATITNIPNCDVETNAIQSLVDNPSESGLTANELKTAFDQDATYLKGWINDNMIDKLNDNFSAINSDSSTLDGKVGNLTNLNTTSKSNVVSAINEVNTNMKTNKVLWTGGYYMTENHTIQLSETVSSQKNGIVLVWSAYINGSAHDSNFNFTFIPKQFVTLFSGKGVTTLMSGTEKGNLASKYVYIHDDHITGNSTNNKSGAENFVLRYVIGV